MPDDFCYETAITVDHEDGVMTVDTTMRGMATALLRAGFREITKPDAHPYRSFLGQADQLRFRKPKGQRSARGRPFKQGHRAHANSVAVAT